MKSTARGVDVKKAKTIVRQSFTSRPPPVQAARVLLSCILTCPQRYRNAIVVRRLFVGYNHREHREGGR